MTASSMASKPSVILELFTGDKSWDEWINHFESVADVCGWDKENKLKWMRMRLSGRAGSVFRHLPDATKADYTQAKTALKNRFEPESRRALYQTRLHSCTKQRGEGWADFGDDLKTLADKAYPDLADEARECFALNQYLSQLNNPQVAFAVKQTKPKTTDEAVRAMLEMESYTKPVSSSVSLVSEEVEKDIDTVAVTTTQRTSELRQILEKMQQMEIQLRELQQAVPRGSHRGRGRKKLGQPDSCNCWNCGGQGHFARDCPSRKTTISSQGNDNPPAP